MKFTAYESLYCVKPERKKVLFYYETDDKSGPEKNKAIQIFFFCIFFFKYEISCSRLLS